MTHLPFSVSKRKGQRFYYVQFKNEQGEFLPGISTRQTTKSAAIEIAFKWLREGRPSKNASQGNVINISISLAASLRDVRTKEEAEFICRELKRQGLLKAYVIPESQQAVDLGTFLLNFWDFDTSPYVAERLRKSHSIHRNYTTGQRLSAEGYWVPFFRNRCLGDITKKDIELFTNDLPEALSGSRKNRIIKAGVIPLRWAFAKDILDRDVTEDMVWFSENHAERQILSPEIVHAIFGMEWADIRAKLANVLSSVTGLRAGEVQGLRVQDLGKESLYVRHSWNRKDKLKTTKNNRDRVVEVPFPWLVEDLLLLAKQNPHGINMDSYIFWTRKTPTKPIEARIFLDGLRDILIKTGMSLESANAYSFHGWRHFFTTYMRGKLNDKLLQSQTGHLSLSMLERYSGHITETNRNAIRQAKVDVFGALVPAKKAQQDLFPESQ
jgi:integrase